MKLTAGTLLIRTGGEEDNSAKAVSGVGGAVAVSASDAITGNTSNTNVIFGRGSAARGIDVDNLVVSAGHAATFQGQANSEAGGAVDASGAEITHNVNANVDIEFRDNAYIQARNISVTAHNAISKPWLPQALNADGELYTPYNLVSASGGVGTFPAGASTTTIENNTRVDIGDGATLFLNGDVHNPGSIRPTAYNPNSMFMSVVLPAPFSPSRPTTSPASSVRSTARLACTSPKRLSMARISSNGGGFTGVLRLPDACIEKGDRSFFPTQEK